MSLSPWQLSKSGTEDGHQMALFAWANMAERHGFKAADVKMCYEDKNFVEQRYGDRDRVFDLWMLFAIPNGGYRNKGEAAKLKATGTKKGYPDIGLDVAKGNFHGLRIELKIKKGRMSPDQKEWQVALNFQGYCTRVCVGWEEAVQTIKDYLTKGK